MVRSMVLSLFNAEAVELFVGGDSGNCSNADHKSCLIFATPNGALHAKIGDRIVKGDDGVFYIDE